MKITINLEKAKEIKKEHIRQERKAVLEQLDVQFMRAVEQGDIEKQREIAAKKQALRDATKHETIVNAEAVEELSGLKLEDLL